MLHAFVTAVFMLQLQSAESCISLYDLWLAVLVG